MVLSDLRAFLDLLSSKGLLKVIDKPLDPKLEIPEFHLRVIDKGGPALLFKNPKDSNFPLVTNLFGTQERVDLAFGERPKKFVQDLVELSDQLLPPKLSALGKASGLAGQALRIGLKNVSPKHAPILHSGPLAPKLSQLPITTSWPEDGGPFVTLPLVYTEHPKTGHHNLGMYRIHVYDDATTGMHWQIHKGGGFHYREAEKMNLALPVTLFNGGAPALILAAIAPLPENVPELLLASLLMGKKVERTKAPGSPHPLIANAEFAFVGEVMPHARRPEGPFGDHYGYYSLQHDYPVFNIRHMWHRKDAIFCATVVGEPRQEDFFIGDYLQDLLSPLFPKVMPAVERLSTFGETGFHCLAEAKVKVRYPREAVSTGHRILGEGQLSLTKVLMLTDNPTPPRPFKNYLESYLCRMDPKVDVHVLSCTSQDTLDYTGPKVNEGSKMMLVATGEPRFELVSEKPKVLPEPVSGAELFCAGCCVLETKASYAEAPNLAATLVLHDSFKAYRLLILVDNLQETLKSEMSFLWTLFTRFEPAADLYSSQSQLNRYHVELTAPLIIDARTKPWYPGRLVMSEDIVKRVDAVYPQIFPN
jgi:4-hydroxybenzoate decarboxylase subunit C